MSQRMHVTVAYATLDKQLEVPLEVQAPCTVASAVKRSGILDAFPHLKLTNMKVGIYNHHVPLTTPVQDGDRIEIYRSLVMDPKQARRLRAKRRKS